MAQYDKTILIADDDPDYLFQLDIIIKGFGYNTITASSQRECEKIIESMKPDLAILDLMMENEDSGFILSYKLKKKYPDVPVIIATAVTAETGISFQVDSEEQQEWIKADRFLDKGIKNEQLENEINQLLN
ncbi:MAG: response regulator [Bacteroidota bacterium]